MPSETTTPNVGLQVPAFNQANWQVPIQYDLNRLDLIFGGAIQVPALSVVNLTVVNVGPMLVPAFVVESPAGSTPGTLFVFSYIPSLLMAVFVNGLFQRPSVDYTVVGTALTFTYTLQSGDNVYAIYF